MMKISKRVLLPIVYGGALLGVMLLAALFSPEEEAPEPQYSSLMTLPPDYADTFVAYVAVDRVDNVTRLIYIHPDSLAALEIGEPFPEGTQVIIEAYDIRSDLVGNPVYDENKRFIPARLRGSIHMAEKRANWPLDELATSSRVGDWNFASFDKDTFQPNSDNINDCFTCHDTAASRDFVFTLPNLSEYVRSGEEQYFYCNRPDRGICR